MLIVELIKHRLVYCVAQLDSVLRCLYQNHLEKSVVKTHPGSDKLFHSAYRDSV